MTRRYPLGDQGLGWALLALFTGSWLLQFVFQVLVSDEPAAQFWASTFENWQSEFLQLLTFMVLTSVLIFKGSPESKDSDDELEAKVDEILERLRREP
jgi:hypothetical protein